MIVNTDLDVSRKEDDFFYWIEGICHNLWQNQVFQKGHFVLNTCFITYPSGINEFTLQLTKNNYHKFHYTVK